MAPLTDEELLAIAKLAKAHEGLEAARLRQQNALLERLAKAFLDGWVDRHGEIPSGLMVLHKCDNRACCNPSHLFLGTQADNMQDAKAKGRLVLPHWLQRRRKPPGDAIEAVGKAISRVEIK